VIKLGRVKLKIKEIKLFDAEAASVGDNNHTKHLYTKNNEKSFNDNRDRISNLNVEIPNIAAEEDKNNALSKANSNQINIALKKSKAICRICYCDDVEVDSPLITPCNCAGTMRFIHFCCMQQWLKSKIVVKSTVTDNCTSYSLKQIECELCKAIFPGKNLLTSRFCQIQAEAVRYKGFHKTFIQGIHHAGVCAQ